MGLGWPGEVESLSVPGAEPAELVELRGGFDAFGDEAGADPGDEPGDGAGDRAAGGVLVDAADEGDAWDLLRRTVTPTKHTAPSRAATRRNHRRPRCTEVCVPAGSWSCRRCTCQLRWKAART